jgi:hypothetical protein
MIESLNSWIIEARFKPILSMLEEIRVLVTRRIQENRSKIERWLMDISPTLSRSFVRSSIKIQYCHVLWNGLVGFEVKYKKLEVHSTSQC